MKKSQLKHYLKKSGLLPLARILWRSFFLRPREFFQNLNSYLYNNVITYFPSYIIRKFYLTKFLGIKIGKGSFVHMGCLFYRNVKIGNNSVIGRQCHLLGNITIKDNVSITAQAYIASSSHYVQSSLFEAYTSPIVIEDYAWIGARAMILPGVKIGKGAVLGATSTATKSIPDYSIYAGSPAKAVGVRSKNLEYQLNYSPFFQ